MAIYYGSNHTKSFVTIPSQKAEVGENGGKLHFSYDSYTGVQNVYGIGDQIKMMKLPAGARIVSITAKCPSLGTTGIFKVVQDIAGVTSDLLTGADAGGQAVTEALGNVHPLGDKLSGEATLYLQFTEASDAADTVKMELAVVYAMA